MVVVWPCYNDGMSNIHHRNGWHGVDDEFDYGRPQRCAPCWSAAKARFFGPDRTPRRGVTLASVYADVHQEAHGD